MRNRSLRTHICLQALLSRLLLLAFSTHTALTQADAPQADVYFPRGGHMHAEPRSERDRIYWTYVRASAVATGSRCRRGGWHGTGSESACRERVTMPSPDATELRPPFRPFWEVPGASRVYRSPAFSQISFKLSPIASLSRRFRVCQHVFPTADSVWTCCASTAVHTLIQSLRFKMIMNM